MEKEGEGRRDERFTVTAPWRIEFEKDIILGVDYDVLIVFSHNNLDGAFLLLRDRLRLDTWLNFAVEETLDKGTNVLLGELLFLVEGELLVLDGFLDSEGGEHAVLEVQVFGVCAKRLGVDCGKVDLAFVLFSKGFEGF